MTVPNQPGLPKLDGPPQIIVEKQQLDCFTAVNLPALLDHLRATDCFVYGVVAEICVKLAAFGLLRSGRRVTIVTDAIKELDAAASARMLAEFKAAGGALTAAGEILRAG